jgi:hypothetical protein
MSKAPAQGLHQSALLTRFKSAIAELRAHGAFVVLTRASEQFALQKALELTLLRGMIIYQADAMYRVNPGKQALVNYYAKSIEHFFEPS